MPLMTPGPLYGMKVVDVVAEDRQDQVNVD